MVKVADGWRMRSRGRRGKSRMHDDDNNKDDGYDGLWWGQ